MVTLGGAKCKHPGLTFARKAQVLLPLRVLSNVHMRSQASAKCLSGAKICKGTMLPFPATRRHWHVACYELLKVFLTLSIPWGIPYCVVLLCVTCRTEMQSSSHAMAQHPDAAVLHTCIVPHWGVGASWLVAWGSTSSNTKGRDTTIPVFSVSCLVPYIFTLWNTTCAVAHYISAWS